MGTPNGSSPATFEEQLEELGFAQAGSTRRGGRMWILTVNRFLTFTVHDYDDELLLTWRFALGEYAGERGWLVGSGQADITELYPAYDVRLPVDAVAVRGEVTRVLQGLQLDLGAPDL